MAAHPWYEGSTETQMTYWRPHADPPRPTPLFVGCLAALLTACASPTPAAQRGAWEGTSTSADGAFPLTLATTLSAAGGWPGPTRSSAAPPSPAASTPRSRTGSSTVPWSSRRLPIRLVGTVSGDALEATFAPTGCPGGAEDVERDPDDARAAPRPPATTPPPSTAAPPSTPPASADPPAPARERQDRCPQPAPSAASHSPP